MLHKHTWFGSFAWRAARAGENFCCAPAMAAPEAAALGPEVALSAPRDGYVGRLDVTPLHGPIGTQVTVTGNNLPANQDFQLVWRTVKGGWKVADHEYHGREYEPVAYEIARVRSDAAGRSVQASARQRISAFATTSSCSRATGYSRRSASRLI